MDNNSRPLPLHLVQCGPWMHASPSQGGFNFSTSVAVSKSYKRMISTSFKWLYVLSDEKFLYTVRLNSDGTSAAQTPPWIYCALHSLCASENVACVKNGIITFLSILPSLRYIRNVHAVAFTSSHSRSNGSLYLLHRATWASRRTKSSLGRVRCNHPGNLEHIHIGMLYEHCVYDRTCITGFAWPMTCVLYKSYAVPSLTINSGSIRAWLVVIICTVLFMPGKLRETETETRSVP